MPANLHLGLDQENPDRAQWTLDAETVMRAVDSGEAVLIDLRDRSERDRHGVIPGSVHAPYPDLDENIEPGGLLSELVRASDKRLISERDRCNISVPPCSRGTDDALRRVTE